MFTKQIDVCISIFAIVGHMLLESTAEGDMESRRIATPRRSLR